MIKQYFSAFFCFVLIVMMLFCPALAAEPEGEPPMIAPVPTVAVFPAEVKTREENGGFYIEKVYYLSVKDNPSFIPTDSFERDGREYSLLDILKTDMSETDTKDYSEVITLESETKELEKIIQTLEPKLEVSTEDGYTGILKPDYTSIKVEASGYGTSSWTASASRTYPNLSEADVSLLPKTTEDSGRTLTLADVKWQETTTDMVDGDAVAVRYTAVATYTATVSGRYATGYTVTVDYSGEVTKTSSDTVVYTAIFASFPEEKPEEPVATQAPEPIVDEPEETAPVAERTVSETPNLVQNQENANRRILIYVLAGVLGVAVVICAIWLIMKYIKK